MSIHLTAAQIRALGELAAGTGSVTLHQLQGEHATHRDGDVYATPQGQSSGFRISAGGETTPIGETLPAEG